MATISDFVKPESKTVEAIYAHYKKVNDRETPRGYLGGSSIGTECERSLWYSFRHCCKPEFDGRMFRLFETGDLEEDRFCKDLRNIGCEVHDLDDTGKQFSVSALGGHFGGHLDGCGLGIPEAPKTWHVLEFKTHCNKSFTHLKSHGVMVSKPQYYAQCQVYMLLTEMTRCLYVAKNKDNDALYTERIHLDPVFAGKLLDRAESIITNTTPPVRISDRPDYYLCKRCDARAICHGVQDEGHAAALKVPCLSCRQCCHATPLMDDCDDGMWKCEKKNFHIQDESRAVSCEDHLCLPGMFTFATPENATEDTITFKNNADGNVWTHGKGDGDFSSKELMALSQQQIHMGMVYAAKDLFGAQIGEIQKDDILSRYPEEDSEIVWRGHTQYLNEAWIDAFRESIEAIPVLSKSEDLKYMAVEFAGDRVVIYYPETQEAEIRIGKE